MRPCITHHLASKRAVLYMFEFQEEEEADMVQYISQVYKTREMDLLRHINISLVGQLLL